MIAIRNVSSSAQARDQYCGSARCSMREGSAFGPPGGAGAALTFLRARPGVPIFPDGYPPYNIERIARQNDEPERLRITLAVAGFTRDQLDVTVEESQLVIRGRQQDHKEHHYLYRGIAARQFQRTFVLAEGMEVLSADLKNGLLLIDLVRPEPQRVVKTVNITNRD